MTARRPIGIPTVLGLATAALAWTALAPAAASAQTADARWMPWVGCWEATGAADDEALLCFRPEGAGVELLTVLDGEVTASESLTADGLSRDVAAEGCSGSESVAFSDDARRIYLSSSQTCEGGASRNASGLIAMVSPHMWIDVKSVEVEGQRTAWAQSYQAAPAERVRGTGLEGLATDRAMAVSAARVAASAPPTVDDVIDAAAHVHDEAVETWLAEVGEPLDLDADQLVRMADAGLSPELIDVVVAVSHPESFALGPDAAVSERADERVTRLPYGGYGGYGAYGRRSLNPFYWDPFYASSYYGVGSYYGRYGYGGYYGGYYPPRVIVVTPRGDGDHGSVVNGEGYRSGRSRAPSSGGASARPSARSFPAGSSAGSSRPTVRSRPAPARSGGSARPAPVRRAKPRGGGGGGGN
jgi:hypothetical protein